MGRRRALHNMIPEWVAAYPTLTAEAYARDIAEFREWLDDRPLNQVDRGTAQAYINHLKERGLKDPTVRRKRSACSSFYTYAVMELAANTNPFAHVRTPRGGNAAKLGLSMEATSRLLTAATVHGPDLHALIQLLILTGVRISGAVTSQITGLGKDSHHDILEVTLKGGATKRVPLAPAVHASILEVIAGRTEGPIFLAPNSTTRHLSRSTAGRWIRTAGDTAGIGQVTPHVLRHTCASLLAAAGEDPLKIQELLGHKDPKTTLNYIHLVQTLDDSPVYRLEKLLAGSAA